MLIICVVSKENQENIIEICHFIGNYSKGVSVNIQLLFKSKI
jgi:hypothetical protein